ncbi:MAG: DsbA family oxidoreductase [Rhodobacteraceae bacterium]|nr:DsbA family oxidoreductase [Paracoccaceae bacterium]
MVRLDIYSDPICPWCYIGKTHLDRALKAAGGTPFEIFWRPFQLNPDMLPEGVGRKAYLEAKFGGPEGAQRIYGAIETAAEAAGVVVNFANIIRTPNTLNAHRLISWAGAEAGVEDCQSTVVDALFTAYFIDGRDIGETSVLADIAQAAGMDRAAVAQLLDGDIDLDDIRKADAEARRRGINSVPTFIINQQHAVPGAQPPELWARVIEDIRTQQEQVH